MKKILLAVTAALAITGCSQNEEFEAPSQKVEINFNTAVTRATELDIDGLKSSGFQVYAYNTKAEEMSATVTLSTPWINGSATYSDSKWTVSGGPYYWYSCRKSAILCILSKRRSYIYSSEWYY
ncbi:fimbrillin family protein [Bacteroides ovatus]|nr:fimbrillin family protein [Bacteroides ovatus]